MRPLSLLSLTVLGVGGAPELPWPHSSWVQQGTAAVMAVAGIPLLNLLPCWQGYPGEPSREKEPSHWCWCYCCCHQLSPAPLTAQLGQGRSRYGALLTSQRQQGQQQCGAGGKGGRDERGGNVPEHKEEVCVCVIGGGQRSYLFQGLEQSTGWCSCSMVQKRRRDHTTSTSLDPPLDQGQGDCIWQEETKSWLVYPSKIKAEKVYDCFLPIS